VEDERHESSGESIAVIESIKLVKLNSVELLDIIDSACYFGVLLSLLRHVSGS
jgi:hypothetical protein